LRSLCATFTCSRVAARLLGLVEAVELVEQHAEVAQMHGRLDVVVAEGAAIRLVDAPLELLGLLRVALPEQHLRVVAPGARRRETVGRLHSLEDRERARELLVGLVQLSLRDVHGAEGGEAARPRAAVRGRDGALANLERSLRHRLRGVEAAEAPVDARHGLEKVRLHVGFAAELGLEPLARLVEEILRRDLSAGLIRIRDLEEPDQKLLDALRAAGGGGRGPRVRLGAPRLPRGGGEPAGERCEDEDRRSHGRAVAAHELTDAVAERVGARLDGLTLAVPAEVAAERGDGAVAPVRLAPQRGEEDVVEVAAQPP
jgi:hypothetical protein